jgi:hypothetical protein
MGSDACKNARIPNVVDSCLGSGACKYIGNQGQVGDFVNSCKGDFVCYYLADGGEVGNIKDSCNGDYACLNLADEGGHVGDITNRVLVKLRV